MMLEPPLYRATTFSKGPEFFGKDFEPSYVTSGRRCYVTGNDGKEYLDWISGLGSVLIGYPDTTNWNVFTAADKWAGHIVHQLLRGVGFSLPHALERTVAEKLATLLGSRVPGWTPDGLGVRWLKTGSDATVAAVRLARAVTGRRRILSFGYHGWHETFVSTTPPAWGCLPQDVETFEWNNTGQLINLVDSGNDVAAIIIEVPMQDAADGWYETLRDICDATGALLIVDEVVTGFRWALGGACEVYGIRPDLCCYGKAIANGMPLSAVVGRREYFDFAFNRPDPVFISSTSFGDALSLSAAEITLAILQWGVTSEHRRIVEHIWHIGALLMDGLRDAGYEVIGHPPRSLVQFKSAAERAYFIRGMAARQILFNRPVLPNLSHSEEDVARTITAAREIRDEMATIDVETAMRGKLPQTLFEGR